MFRPRVIPCLLLKNKGLVKTVKFQNPRYLGDPINAIWLFNKKEADELIFLDIEASTQNRSIDLELVSRMSDESFMPLSVGGGIKDIETIRKCFNAGAEKVVINSGFIEKPELVSEAAEIFGSQSIVVSIDAKLVKGSKYETYINNGTKRVGIDPVTLAKKAELSGAGEIFINSIDRDGTQTGYDIQLSRLIADAVKIPVIACGGAGKLSDLAEVYLKGKVTAVVAGSLFVYHGSRNAVLINYPGQSELNNLFTNAI